MEFLYFGLCSGKWEFKRACYVQTSLDASERKPEVITTQQNLLENFLISLSACHKVMETVHGQFCTGHGEYLPWNSENNLKIMFADN